MTYARIPPSSQQQKKNDDCNAIPTGHDNHESAFATLWVLDKSVATACVLLFFFFFVLLYA